MTNRIDPSALTPEILLRAYSIGLFPMAESADDPHLFWVDPPIRGVFPLDGLVVSRSLAKVVRGDRFEVRVDHDFDAVIDACAQPMPDRPDTWINATIRDLYKRLFQRGFVHTVEVYNGKRLAGGLYGVSLGGAFFGESMFHRATDASKVALVHLVAQLRLAGFVLLDTQFVTPHLATLGAIEIPRADYRRALATAVSLHRRFDPPQGERHMRGAECLAALQ